MAKQPVNIGAAPNDGTGDPLRDAFDKINDNFDELYAIAENLTAIGLNGQAFAVWTGTGLVFDVTWPSYYIDGVLYAAGSEQITLDAADPSNPRTDVIALDSTGAIKIAGVAAANPIKPTVNSTTQIEITSVLIDSGATTPSDIVNVDVYKENTEWTGSSDIGTANFNSTSGPFEGSKCTEVGAFSNGQFIKYVAPAPVSAGSYNVIRLRINLKQVFSSGQKIRLRLFNGLTTVSIVTTPTIQDGDYGFRGDILGWQLVTIPMSAFTLSQSAFDTLYFEMVGSTSLGFKLDNIAFQGGSVTASEDQDAIKSIFTPAGTANANQPDDTINFVGDGITISASGKTVTFTLSGKSDRLERVAEKSAHGFVLKNILTLDGSGELVKVTTPSSSKFIGIVTEVIDTDTFRMVQSGYVTGLSGLTAGSVHYATTSGTLSTIASGMPVLFADSTSSGYILTQESNQRLKPITHSSVVNLDDNKRSSLTITGAIAYTKGSEAHIIGNIREDHLTANGANKPTFSSDFVVIWDNWVNTNGTLNVIRFEYLSNGKIQVDIRNS